MAVCLGSKAALATTLASRPGVPRIAADLLQRPSWQSRANFGRQSVLSEGILPRRLCGDQRKRRSDDSLASSIDCAGSNSSSDMVGEGACCRARMKVIKTIDRLGRFEFPGIVSVCPYYNRPTQDGLLQHFAALSDATDRQILIYNIPYRTSVNLSNDTLLRLAGRRNIVGVKDSSGGIAQSLELLARRPTDFSVLTGEDSLFFTMICNGADGGILAAAHLATEQFVEIARLVTSNDHVAARTIWSSLRDFIPRLFREANPMPIKYCLWRQVSSVRPSAASHCHRSPKGLHGNSITGSRKLRLLRAFSV
jgi:hypothetical protein